MSRLLFEPWRHHRFVRVRRTRPLQGRDNQSVMHLLRLWRFLDANATGVHCYERAALTRLPLWTNGDDHRESKTTPVASAACGAHGQSSRTRAKEALLPEE